MIPIIDDTGRAADVSGFRRALPTSTSSTSPRSPPRNTSSHRSDAIEHDVVDLTDEVTEGMLDRNLVEQPRKLQQGGWSGICAEELPGVSRSDTVKSVALQDQAPAVCVTPSPSTKSVQETAEAVENMTNGNNARLSGFKQTRIPLPGPAVNLSTSNALRQTPIKPAALKAPPDVFPYPQLMPASARANKTDSLPASSLATNPQLSGQMTGHIQNAWDMLTPNSKQHLESFVSAPPPKLCYEYCANLNFITAATPRLAAHQQKIARYQTSIAELKVKIDHADAAAGAKKSKIMEDHKESTKAALDISSYDERMAACNAYNEQVTRASDGVNDELAKATEVLKYQVKNLEGLMEEEKRCAGKLWEENNNANIRKRKMDTNFGGQLAFWIGTEVAKDTKRQRNA